MKSTQQTSSNASLQTLMLVLTLALVFLMAARVPVDPDMWWHLRTGEETVAAGQPYLTDTLTFTRYGAPWVNHSWLSEVVLYLIYRYGGTIGLGLYVALLVVATMALLYHTLGGGVFMKAGIIVLTSAVMALVWSPRPQLISFLLFAGLNYWLQRYMQRKTRLLWPLPLVFILWGNLHAGYSLGFMLLGITIGGLILDRLLWPAEVTTLTWPEIGRLSDWTAISLLAVVVNPNGFNTWKIPFQTIGKEAGVQYIIEWASPDFHMTQTLPYLALLFACVIALAWSGKRASGSEITGLTLFGVASLLSQRNFAPFALFTAVVLSNHAAAAWNGLISPRLQQLKEGYKQSKRSTHDQRALSPRLRKVVNLTLVGLILLIAFGRLIYVTHPTIVKANMQNYYPIAAVDYLEKYAKPGNIFNDYGWGGYLDWRLREFKVFIDGRADLYGGDIIQEVIDTTDARGDWQEALDYWQVDYILVMPNVRLVDKAIEADWEILFQDKVSVLLGKK
ncbi:MAG: hypothetical protein C0396_01835 [Anaerolinea sp.]|nr:hypothetical protein [Anaerolinea sp.]